MGFDAELRAIEERFAAGWSAHATTFPAVYGDAPFKIPQTGAWVRLSVAQGGGEQIELGSVGVPAMHRFSGIVFVQAFVPQAGSARPDRVAAQIADLVAEVFQRRILSLSSGGTLRLYTTSLGRSPLLEKTGSGTLQYLIQTPYDRDEVA